MKYALKSLIAAVLAAGAVASQAAVVPIDGSSPVFAGASPITFGEATLGTVNPTIGSVSFGSFFAGQSLGNIISCGIGGFPTGVTNCVLGNPTGPLSLAGGGKAQIVNDPAQASSPVLAGSASFTSGDPIAMLFASDVSAISFTAGGFNNLGNTRVLAFSRTGAILGELFNPADPAVPGAPADFFTFAFGSTGSDGTTPENSIAGILISLIDVEAQGFAIDNIRTVVSAPPSTGTPSTGTPNETPEPTSLALVGLALLGLGIAKRRLKA